MATIYEATCDVLGSLYRVLRRAFRAHFMLDHVDTDQDWIDRGW